MPQNNELRVFISSTFRDLQEEREHLVKKIFPEIRALCRERGITFTEVDLRWGLTEEDVVLGQVIRTCLEEIDKCRPYFIGITGERYGYVPELHEYYKDPELLAKWPWIEAAAMDGSSLIDLEFRHAVLNDSASANGMARFFFRRQRCQLDGGDGNTEETERLERLKRHVREAELPVEEYRDAGSLGEMVYDQLIEIIKRDYADAKPPTPLEEERSRHRAFAASRVRAYIPNPEYLKKLNEWLTSDGQPMVLYAESGSGKSSLVAFWCEQMRRKTPALFIIEHYVGIGAGDSDHLGIIRHIMEEIKLRYDLSEELPSKPEEMERDFANWLGFGVGSSMVIVIDGINQLTGRALELHWLLPVMPAGVKLIISSTVEQTLVDLRNRGWQQLGMQPLKERERESLVVRFLAEYHKALSPQQVRLIAEDAKCAHPLFLRTLLEELRLHGTHEHLDRVLTTLLESTGTEDLFQRVLERLEEDYNLRIVRDVMTLIWASKNGLSEEELSALTGISRLKLSTLLLGLDYHLVRRDGLLTFFHDYLRRAVAKRYLSEERKRRGASEQLCEHFERVEVTLRSTRELVHALEMLGERSRLEGVLSRIERFVLLWGSDHQEVLRLWSASEPSAVAVAYRQSMEVWEADGAASLEERARVLGEVGSLCEVVGAWSEAEQVWSEQLSTVRALGDRSGEVGALVSLAGLARLLGRMEESERLAREAEQMARELGDHRGIASALGNRGNVHLNRGEYAEALECYQEQESIARELGDRRGIASALGNRGNVHDQRGEYAEALACHQEQESIARELGDRRSSARAIGNRGNVHLNRGDLTEAVACFQEAESIARELGDRRGIVFALGSRGAVHLNRGEYAEALACYQEQELIVRESGDRQSIAFAVGNRGTVHLHRGEYAEALACYQEQESIARELGDRRNFAQAVGNRGLVHSYRGEYAEALECYQEHESISRELGDRRSIAQAVGNRGLVHSYRGEYAEALACYQEQESIARELGYHQSMAISIGNRGLVHSDRGEYSEALECFREAATEHRAIGFRNGLSYWLEGTGRVLVECATTVEQNGSPMPEYLAEYIGQATDELWQVEALRVAREHAGECVAISEELSKPDTLFLGRMLLARITAAEGLVASAVNTLQAMLIEAESDEQRGELHYWLWKIGAEGNHGTTALDLFKLLIEKMPKHDYHARIEELIATANPPQASNATE